MKNLRYLVLIITAILAVCSLGCAEDGLNGPAGPKGAKGDKGDPGTCDCSDCESCNCEQCDCESCDCESCDDGSTSSGGVSGDEIVVYDSKTGSWYDQTSALWNVMDDVEDCLNSDGLVSTSGACGDDHRHQADGDHGDGVLLHKSHVDYAKVWAVVLRDCPNGGEVKLSCEGNQLVLVADVDGQTESVAASEDKSAMTFVWGASDDCSKSNPGLVVFSCEHETEVASP